MSFVKESRSIVFQAGKQSTVLGEKFVPNKMQKKGRRKNYSCSVGWKGMPQARGFEDMFSFYHDEESAQREAQNLLTWVYQVTLVSPAIMGSQPLLRSETCPLSPMRTLEHISVGVSSTKHELIGKEKQKHIWGNAGHSDWQLDLSKYRLSRSLNFFMSSRSTISIMWLGI